MSKEKPNRVISQFIVTNYNGVLGSMAISGLPKLPIRTAEKASTLSKQVLHNDGI